MMRVSPTDLTCLFDPTINGKLLNGICQEHLQAILTTMRGIVISDRLKSAIDLLLANIPVAWQANGWVEFRELTTPFISWV